MKVPLLDISRHYELIKDELNPILMDVLSKGRYIMGPNVKEFEKEIASYIGVNEAVSVANGTDALFLIMTAYEIGCGDEVITTPYTFFASAETISQCGARPVFVDIDPVTLNIDVSKLEKAITPRTKAIMPVHIFGQMCPMDEIMAIAKKHNVLVIEDACQAIGAKYREKMAGSFGDAAAFSFFPTKNLGCFGDGGLVATNDQKLADKIRLLRHHGSPQKYHHSIIGYNSRLDELQAAALRFKLPMLATWNQRRRELAAQYTKSLRGLPLELPEEQVDTYHVYHLYVMKYPKQQQLRRHLADLGISTGTYYPLPVHVQEAYHDLGYSEGDFPVAEKVCKMSFAIPLFPEMEDREQVHIISAIKSYFEGEDK